MVRLPQAGEGCDFVGASHTGVNMVQSFMPSCARDTLMKLWKYRSQSAVIKVPSDKKAPIWVHSL